MIAILLVLILFQSQPVQKTEVFCVITDAEAITVKCEPAKAGDPLVVINNITKDEWATISYWADETPRRGLGLRAIRTANGHMEAAENCEGNAEAKRGLYSKDGLNDGKAYCQQQRSKFVADVLSKL